MSMQLFNSTSFAVSKRLALNYSTSFSLGIRLLGAKYRDHVFAVYGLVRIADEIVDTFYGHDQHAMLGEFRQQTYKAIETGISTNPVLHAFQNTANAFSIGRELIDPFFDSMAADLMEVTHSDASYQKYIFGSAEVVGLMCLKIFCNGKEEMYKELTPYARSLGAAFQKVNFLRDIKSDLYDRGRVYFPGVNFHHFTETEKQKIIADIHRDFKHALIGIRLLPNDCRTGVYTAFIYYKKLLQKIENKPVQEIKAARIRIPDGQKLWLLVKSVIQERMRLASAF